MNTLLLERALAVFAFALYQNAALKEPVCYEDFSLQVLLL